MIKNLTRKFLNRIGLSIKGTLAIITILGVTACITWILIFVMISLGFITENNIVNPKIITAITLVSCTIVGTIITTLVSRAMVKAVKDFIDASNHVANGDFSARVMFKHPTELRRLAENFNRMAEELNGIEVLRTDFINNFSHEFKTPIVSIKGFAEVLRADDLSKEERDEYLDIVISESSRLASLASRVLEFTKIEQQSIVSEKTCFNLGEQIRQCILLLDAKFNQKNIQLELNLYDTYIGANREMLSQVWVNLLDNAIKFTESQGTIWIRMHIVAKEVEVEIRDNGCGIEQEALSHIFDKFYQADHSHAMEGNGLGLAMVKKIIDLHGGSISCQSQLGQGTVFKIKLPLDGEIINRIKLIKH